MGPYKMRATSTRRLKSWIIQRSNQPFQATGRLVLIAVWLSACVSSQPPDRALETPPSPRPEPTATTAPTATPDTVDAGQVSDQPSRFDGMLLADKAISISSEALARHHLDDSHTGVGASDLLLEIGYFSNGDYGYGAPALTWLESTFQFGAPDESGRRTGTYQGNRIFMPDATNPYRLTDEAGRVALLAVPKGFPVIVQADNVLKMGSIDSAYNWGLPTAGDPVLPLFQTPAEWARRIVGNSAPSEAIDVYYERTADGGLSGRLAILHDGATTFVPWIGNANVREEKPLQDVLGLQVDNNGNVQWVDPVTARLYQFNVADFGWKFKEWAKLEASYNSDLRLIEVRGNRRGNRLQEVMGLYTLVGVPIDPVPTALREFWREFSFSFSYTDEQRSRSFAFISENEKWTPLPTIEDDARPDINALTLEWQNATFVEGDWRFVDRTAPHSRLVRQGALTSLVGTLLAAYVDEQGELTMYIGVEINGNKRVQSVGLFELDFAPGFGEVRITKDYNLNKAGMQLLSLHVRDLRRMLELLKGQDIVLVFPNESYGALRNEDERIAERRFDTIAWLNQYGANTSLVPYTLGFEIDISELGDR